MIINFPETNGSCALTNSDNGIINMPGLQLKKDGTPKKVNHKKESNKKSEVYHIEIEDMKKIIHYFEEKEKWIHYLIFILSCNMARRISDTLSLTWEHFFYPQTGNFRTDILTIKEKKTDKLANPRINTVCKKAIEKYIEKTGCDPSDNNYKNPVFLQLSSTHPGKVMTRAGYYKALKSAGESIDIKYNIGTHSPRKTFGWLNMTIHPGDPSSKELLKYIFNHSDTKVTERYIGITKSKIDKYFDDVGQFFDDYVLGDEIYTAGSPVVSILTNDLYNLIKKCYNLALSNASHEDPMIHVDAFNEIISCIPELIK